MREQVKELARGAWGRVRGGELTPFRAAASVAVGLAIGVTPLWGLHFWLVLLVCLPLKLDAAVAYVAANISIPPVSPFLTLAEIEIGAWAHTGRGLALTVAEVRARRIGELVTEIALGTLVFAPAVATVGFAVTFAIVSRARAKRRAPSPIDASIGRVAARYAPGRRAAFHYVRGKLAGDPVAARIASLGALGEVADVGCGRGQLAVLLLEANVATRVWGVDWDAAKVGDATRAAHGLAATFEAGDVRAHAVPACDTALLVDVLHYMSDEAQDALLTKVARAARRRVLVRELDPDRGWRSAVTRAQEAITTRIRYNRGERLRHRPIEALAAVLRREGFDVVVEPCWGKTPFANVLVVAERR